ncbi:hypothetical protein BGAL_0738g00020 [Botrytis galanthina]|uniref:Uncharacterized protein n=1 Tax=Botrytis galanthina TaxID=278940 RepID=A0A4S8QH45_9HELO|nr:hypothetical protein BGAL_0738g00020 [Botrytis galanthina]
MSGKYLGTTKGTYQFICGERFGHLEIPTSSTPYDDDDDDDDNRHVYVFERRSPGAGDRIRKDLVMDCSVHTGTVRFQGKQARKPKQYEYRGSRIGSRMSHLHGMA